jgi:phage tail sheath gpL-like
VLILGQKISTGTKSTDVVMAITRSGLADGYYGAGSILARMCNVFKSNNPNTELYAMAVSDNGAGVKSSCALCFSIYLSHAGGVVSTNGETINLMINGSAIPVVLTSGWSVGQVNSAVRAAINAMSTLPVNASTTAASVLLVQAVCPGVCGNGIDVRFNYNTGESWPRCFVTTSGASLFQTPMAGGANNPSLAGVWAIIDGEQYHHIIQPYTDSTNLKSLEDELADRYKPLVDLQGHGYTCERAAVASCTTLGNSRNSPHNTIMCQYDSPTDPAEWAAALGAVASWNLNNDPARPLQFLSMKGILPPPAYNRFTRAERDTILYDGISTFIVDSGGSVMIERVISTYQTNALGIADPSYLDIETLFTLMEIRYQWKARMVSRFIIPRFKLADDTFPVQPGSYVVTPKTVKQETIALFSMLQEKGLIENLEDFKTNLVVERDLTDVNRVNVLLPPDLINQFRVLAGNIQFIL